MKRKVAKSLPCSFFDLSGSQLAESFDWPNAIRPIVKASEGFVLEFINFPKNFWLKDTFPKSKVRVGRVGYVRLV